jgi:AcrR family transcriptional regulator
MPDPAQDDDAQLAARARASGRPLDEAVDAAILNATWQLLLEEGYSSMSIARIAALANVGRPAIYRRYRDKSELVGAVIAGKSAALPTIDTGHARDDVIAHLELARKRFALRVAGAMIVEERNHPELLEYFREGMARPQRARIADALRRGQERGEVRADLDCELAAEALMGSFMFHFLTSGRPSKGWSERVVDTLWAGFSS